jgi:hypothetical protein
MLTQKKQPPLGTQLNRSHPLAQGLVGAYIFNQGGGFSVIDSTSRSGPARNAPNGAGSANQFIKPLLYSNGLYGLEMVSSGTLGGQPNLSQYLTGEITVSCWFVCTNVQTRLTLFNDFRSPGTNTTDHNFNVGMGPSGPVKIGVSWASGGVESMNAGLTTISNNTLYHLVAIRSGVAGNWTVSIYLNGVLDNQITGITTNPSGVLSSTFFGARFNGSSFGGTISDFFIWNKALDPTSVRRLYTDTYSMFITPRANPIKRLYDTPPNLGVVSSNKRPDYIRGYNLNGSSTLSQGLVFSQLMSDGNNSIIDSSILGRQFTGSFTNAPTWVYKEGRRGLSFNGSSNYITMDTTASSTSALSAMNGICTISAWVYLTDNTTLASGEWIITDGVSGGQGFTMYINSISGGAGSFTAQYATGNSASSLTFMTLNKWNHIVITRSGVTGSWTYNFYLNGILSRNISGVAQNPAGTSNIIIGRAGSVSSNYLKNTISNIQIWNRPLTATEVNKLWQQPYLMYNKKYSYTQIEFPRPTSSFYNSTVNSRLPLSVSNGGLGITTASGILVGEDIDPIFGKSQPIGTLIGTTETQTLTNKNIKPRIQLIPTLTSSVVTDRININVIDGVNIYSQATNINNLSNCLVGTPTDGQRLLISITDNGTSRTIIWGSLFESSTIILPTATIPSTRMDVGFIWNATTSRWRCVAAG